MFSSGARKSFVTGVETDGGHAQRQNGRNAGVSSRSTKRSNTAQRVALLAAEALGPFYSIAVHRRDGAALQTLCVGSQRRRRIDDRSVMASVRDSKRERLLLVLLMTCVYESTHATLDLVKCQQPLRLIRTREVLTAAICLPQL